MKRTTVVIAIIIIILILDQWLKVYIKTTLPYGGGFDIFGLSWAKIHFVENPGMAFGISFGGEIGKLMLSLFRIFMVCFLVYFIAGLVKAKESIGLLISVAAIIAGALGNIIDSAVYGLIFSASHHGTVASMFPEGGGYGSFLQGKVVDMLYFPLIKSEYPDWFPFFGGEPFLFFKPVFNIADAAISTGVISIILFYRKFFKGESPEEIA